MNELLEVPAPEFGIDAARMALLEHFDLDAGLTPLDSERDQNFRADTANGRRFLVKISNSAEKPDVIDFENALMTHLDQARLPFATPRPIRARDGSFAARISGSNRVFHALRVQSWLPGRGLYQVEGDASLRFELGESLALLTRSLDGFDHVGARRELLWDLQQFPRLESRLRFVDDAELRGLIATFLTRFNGLVAPRLPDLRSQIVYNDLNPGNVLVSRSDPPVVCGIVDFGDAVFGPPACDLAIAACYQLSLADDTLADALDTIAGYDGIAPLTDTEIELLPDLIIARAATSVLIAAWRVTLHPENRDYILTSSRRAMHALRQLVPADRDRLRERVLSVCRGGTRPPRRD